jgi:tRNA uridine 5-carbamoylmethylation protein Kti12
MSPVALFLCGIPCSGKTYYASQSKFDNYEYICSSDYIEYKMKEHNITKKEALVKYRSGIKKYIKNKIISTVEQGKSFILDQTNTYQSARIKKISLVPEFYHKKAIYFILEYKDALKINDQRYLEEGEYTYPKLIKHFYDEYVYPTKEEGFDEVLGIYR